MSPTQPGSPQGPVVDMLWKQLTELNAAVDATGDRCTGLGRLQYKIMEMGQHESVKEDFEEEIRNLEILQSRLEGLRDTTRRTINEAVRPLLRPLRILDLPDELLRHIFLYVRGRTSMYKLAFYDMIGGDAEQIKKLRLTCRRFCVTSSHLLMFYVKVDMTSQSLAHLDEVSRHSTISKGIRAVKICLGRHFDHDIACDTRAFALYQGTKLRNYLDSWEMSIQNRYPHGEVSRDVLQRAIHRGTIIADSFDEAAQHGLNETCPEHVLLRAAQECYRQHHETQLLLQHGPFAQATFSAMMRMPTATWLSIQDGDIRAISGPDWESDIIYPENLENVDTLRLKLEAPSFSWSMARYRGLRSPPVDVIPSILLSIGEAGIRLTGLDIDVPLPDNLSSFSRDQVTPSKMQASSQQLKAFACRPRHAVPLSKEAVPLLTGFLSTILQTSSLQRIDLCFDFMSEESSGLQPIASMAPILFSRSWPSLEELSFTGPFHFQDLRNLVNHIDKNVDLQWSGYLMDGSWAGVLDFLRDCRLHATITLGDVNGSIAGAECENMSRAELDHIFRENDFTPSLASESRAARYIRGWTTRNPVTDWIHGDLELLLRKDDSELGEYQGSDTISDGDI